MCASEMERAVAPQLSQTHRPGVTVADDSRSYGASDILIPECSFAFTRRPRSCQFMARHGPTQAVSALPARGTHDLIRVLDEGFTSIDAAYVSARAGGHADQITRLPPKNPRSAELATDRACGLNSRTATRPSRRPPFPQTTRSASTPPPPLRSVSGVSVGRIPGVTSSRRPPSARGTSVMRAYVGASSAAGRPQPRADVQSSGADTHIAAISQSIGNGSGIDRTPLLARGRRRK